MVDEIEELKFFSVAENKEEKCFFDFKYEFDAPHCYDFNRSETVWEAEESELWFESAGSYPPSRKPFLVFFFFFIKSKLFFVFINSNKNLICDLLIFSFCNKAELEM